MKIILKAAVLFGILVLLSAVARAGDLVPKEEGYFRAGLELSGFGELRTEDLDKERSAAGIGASLFFTESIGVGVQTALQDTSGSFVDSFVARGIYRIPINQNAIYGFAGGERLLNQGEWAILGGVGVERRWTKNIGTFLEIGFNKQLTGDRNIFAVPSVGVRYAF